MLRIRFRSTHCVLVLWQRLAALRDKKVAWPVIELFLRIGTHDVWSNFPDAARARLPLIRKVHALIRELPSSVVEKPRSLYRLYGLVDALAHTGHYQELVEAVTVRVRSWLRCVC